MDLRTLILNNVDLSNIQVLKKWVAKYKNMYEDYLEMKDELAGRGIHSFREFEEGIERRKEYLKKYL